MPCAFENRGTAARTQAPMAGFLVTEQSTGNLRKLPRWIENNNVGVISILVGFVKFARRGFPDKIIDRSDPLRYRGGVATATASPSQQRRLFLPSRAPRRNLSRVEYSQRRARSAISRPR